MGVNKVNLSNGETLIDISKDTVTPDTLAEGSTAHNSNGEKIVGRAVFGGGGGGDSSTLIVKAVPILDFSNGFEFAGISSIDKSIAEILTAANEGKNVLLEFNVGIALGIVQYARFVMTLYSDTNLNFDGVFDMSGSGSPSFIASHIKRSPKFISFNIEGSSVVVYSLIGYTQTSGATSSGESFSAFNR